MIFWWCGAGVIALFLFFFAFGLFCFLHACRRRKRYPADRREHGGNAQISPESLSLLRESRAWLDDHPYEAVSIRSCDGLRLCGRLLCPEAPRGLVILFHGYHSSCRRDLSLQAKRLYEEGYGLLLVSQRSHGESEGTYICFGVKEREDVLAWSCFVAERFGDLPIALMGLSMGAASVMMASALPLPPQVRCIVADCGFSSPWEITARTLRRKHHIYPYPVIYFMSFWARNLAGFDYRQATAEDAVRESSLPLLLIHGEDDLYVPCDMSRRIRDAAPQRVRLLTVPHAKHSQSVFYDTEGYMSALLTFLGSHLAQRS